MSDRGSTAVTAPTVTAYTGPLAELAARLDPATLPPNVLHEMGRITLDSLGCAVAGRATPMGQIALDLARDTRGKLGATAIGDGRASILPAVFANVTLTNSQEYEVQGPEGHICAVSAPVALAVAEALDASGPELVGGLVAGLEVAGRIGGALRRPARRAGVAGGHGHVVFAAAAAAGRLLHLTPEQMHHAMGIAGYGATIRTTERYQGSHKPLMIKNSLGVMAQAGVQAALLAQRGFTGDLEVLEGELGFWRFTYTAGCDWEYLTHELGNRWIAPQVGYKPFPSALNLVSTLQLLTRVAEEHALEPDAIERVEIRYGRRPAPSWPTSEMNPTNFWHHQHYLFAAALARVRPGRSWADPATYRRQDVLALMERLDLQALREGEVTRTEARYEENWAPVRVSIRADGRTFDGAQDAAIRLTDEELRAKFRDNVQGLLSPDHADAIEKCCEDLMALGSARQIAEHLRT